MTISAIRYVKNSTRNLLRLDWIEQLDLVDMPLCNEPQFRQNCLNELGTLFERIPDGNGVIDVCNDSADVIWLQIVLVIYSTVCAIFDILGRYIGGSGGMERSTHFHTYQTDPHSTEDSAAFQKEAM
ncbi:unnamed protein product [Schistocephalus solidus]|uniref:Protein tweety homolog n=1 Tax=Schistocephalus solidus TaxID=70667 RepID=A0A183SRM9_SCHSO|nr:unnamed protein product [Schistocephalus solidus]